MKSFYQFSAGETVAHKLDPRTKLIFVLCLMIAAFIVPRTLVALPGCDCGAVDF